MSSGDDSGHVILGFDVFSPATIEELADHLASSPEDDGLLHYDLGTVSFDEADAERRADALDSAIGSFLDRVSAAPREALHGERCFVRLFVTFGGGAQTIGSATMQRLAGVNATLWIDS